MTTLLNKPAVGCRFCSLLAGTRDTFNSEWLSEDDYKAIVSIGAMVPGWSLICPVRHVVNLNEDYARDDFWTFARTAARTLDDRYGACTFFEHGAARESSLTGCGVGHAHGHLVPLPFSLEAEARRFEPGLSWRKCAVSEVKRIASNREYLFVASKFDGEFSVGSLCVLEQATSQFFRRVIARRLGIGDLYDYRQYPMLELAAETANELRAHSPAVSAGG
jgi:ATP adenylyltransferase